MITRLAFVLIIFQLGIEAHAQDVIKKKTFIEALENLEERFDISFTYADEHIIGETIVPPPEDLTIDEALEYLEQFSEFKFKRLSSRLITIFKKEPELKKICGYIIDNQSNTGIRGATLQTKSGSAVSDNNGYFEIFATNEKDTVLVRCLGYMTSRFATYDFKDDCLELNLEQKITKLQEIIISNFITSGIEINSEGATKIDAETLGILPGLTDPDVLQTIQALPGIQSINETVSDINVRGGTNDQNIIYWDGIKMYQTGHFFGLISAFNPYLTKEVILTKNGTTTALSDGVSSTIDIRTFDNVDKKLSGGAGINMINADMYLKTPLGNRVSLDLSTRRSISDLVQTPTYDQFFNRVFRNTDVISSEQGATDTLLNSKNNFNFYDFSAKLIYDISARDKLRVSFLTFNNSISYEERESTPAEAEQKTSGLDQGSIVSGINYQRFWSDKFTTTGSFYATSYNLDAINHDILNNQRLIQENKVLETSIKLESRIALTNTLDLLVGYQFIETGVTNLEDINNPVYRRYIKKVLRSHAIFAEGNYSSPSQSSNLRFGLRTNYYEKFNKWIFEPRLAFNQKILKHLSFEVLGEMKNQTATQVIDLQNDFLGVEKRRWILSNEEDIPVVTSRQLSAGIRYHTQSFILSVDGYIKNVHGITSSSQGFQNQFQYVRSSGSYEVRGVDILLNKQFGPFTSWISYTYSVNSYEFPDFTPAIFPNNLDIRHVATFGMSYQYKGFQTSLGLNWRTGKPITLPLYVQEDEIIYDTPNSANLEEYARVDFSAKYRLKFSGRVTGELGASIWNVFDNKNIINTYFELNDSNQLETVQQYALGFTPNVMFRIYF